MNDPFDPMTLSWQSDLVELAIFQHIITDRVKRVKKVMRFSLNRIANVKLLTCIKIGGRWLVIGFWVGL